MNTAQVKNRPDISQTQKPLCLDSSLSWMEGMSTHNTKFFTRSTGTKRRSSEDSSKLSRVFTAWQRTNKFPKGRKTGETTLFISLIQ